MYNVMEQSLAVRILSANQAWVRSMQSACVWGEIRSFPLMILPPPGKSPWLYTHYLVVKMLANDINMGYGYGLG